MTGHGSQAPAHRQWAVGLLISALVLNIFSGYSHHLGLPFPPDRVFLAASLGLLVLDGGLREILQQRPRLLHGLMAATVCWVAWSALVHQTLLTSYGFYALLDRLVVPLLLFLVAPLVFREEWSRRWLLKTLIVLGIYLGVTAVFEMARFDALVFPTYIMDPDVGILFGRARGPFAAAEANGMALAACLFASAAGIALLRGGWRVTAAVGAALSTVGVLMTLTRSVWLGVALVAVLALIVPSPVRRTLLSTVAGGVFLLAGILLAFPQLASMLVERLTTQRSVYDRQNTNAAAVRAILEHPIDGVGWMRYLSQSVDWVRQADLYPVTNVDIEIHNVVLARAAELGLIGAALWVALLLAGPGVAIVKRPAFPELRPWQYILTGYACVYAVCMMVSPVPYPLANYLLWLFAGIMTVRPADAPVERLVLEQRPG